MSSNFVQSNAYTHKPLKQSEKEILFSFFFGGEHRVRL